MRRGRRSPSCPLVPDLAEGEGVGLDARIQEGDLEGALGDRAGLADELVQPRFGQGAVALVVDVGAVGGSRGLPVEAHPEPDWDRRAPVGAMTRCRSRAWKR